MPTYFPHSSTRAPETVPRLRIGTMDGQRLAGEGDARTHLLGFWNSGTPLSWLLELDIGRSGTNRELRPEYD
ncbi:hypothetical protein [Streptomyces umbrinus]|uniref:hypothetical protein n=1 Tax=Streptomyces umbrinus TaxID=67370 RepID=UPI00216AD3DD|nr:hypothetical protein [Streptomyces umbrinus]